MESTDGLRRGMNAVDRELHNCTSRREVLGRVFNVLGKPIDNEGEFAGKISNS